MTNYYFGIKIKSKIAQTNQSIENSQTMLLKKEVSRKKSDKLSFQNKNNIKIAQIL